MYNERARCDGSAARIVIRPGNRGRAADNREPARSKEICTGRAAVELVAAGRDIAANDTAAGHNHRTAHHDCAAGIDIQRASQVCIVDIASTARTDAYLTACATSKSWPTDCSSHRRRPGPEPLHSQNDGVGWPRSRPCGIGPVADGLVEFELPPLHVKAAGVTLIVTVVAFEVRKPLLA